MSAAAGKPDRVAAADEAGVATPNGNKHAIQLLPCVCNPHTVHSNSVGT